MTIPTGRRNQNVGKHGENLANSTMNMHGIEQIEKIATPVILRPYHNGRRIVPGVFHVKHGEEVAGDRRAVLPGGTSVLAEVKTVEGDRLIYSKLKDHQHAGLALHSSFGGLSLVVWVSDYGAFLMRYPIAGFVRRSSVTVERARELHETTVQWIAERIKSDL